MSQPSTEITRLRDKGSTDRASLDELLDEIHIGHFGVVDPDSGMPVVLPSAIVRDGDRILAHGSTGSRWMRALAEGAPTCLAVTADDGVVVARSAFESSIHYRSAVLFGSCTILGAEEQLRALDVVTEALIPGRVAELRRPRPSELAATLVLALPIERWSLKVSDKWPEDFEDDISGPAWAGIVPRVHSYGAPLAAPDLRDGIEMPDSVRNL